MKKIIAAALGLSLSMHCDLAQAGFESGNQLFDSCTAKEGSTLYFQRQARCNAYIIGVYETTIFFAQYNDVGKMICVPDGVTAGQLVDVVTNYMSQHPENRHYVASNIVLISLGVTFRCDR